MEQWLIRYLTFRNKCSSLAYVAEVPSLILQANPYSLLVPIGDKRKQHISLRLEAIREHRHGRLVAPAFISWGCFAENTAN